MTIPLDTSDNGPLTLSDDQVQDGSGLDGALGPSVQTPGSGMVGSMARRLGAAPPAGLSPDPPSLGSGQALSQGEEDASSPEQENLSSSLVSEADLGDLDLYAEYALSHIGLAALTGGIDTPARSLVGLIPDPSPQDGEGESGAEAPPGPEETESSEQTENSAIDSAAPGGPEPGLLAGSSDVPQSTPREVPVPGTAPTGAAAPVGRGSAPRLETAPRRPDVPAPQAQGTATRPASGRLTSGFGNRINPVTGKPEFHGGQDIANSLGADVLALRGGTVIHVTRGHKHGDQDPNSVTIMYDASKSEPMEYGIYDHVGSGLNVGDIVTEGQVVGQTDMSGPTIGPHLHYEHGIQQRGTEDVDWIDPKELLNAASPYPDLTK